LTFFVYDNNFLKYRTRNGRKPVETNMTEAPSYHDYTTLIYGLLGEKIGRCRFPFEDRYNRQGVVAFASNFISICALEC